MAGLTLSGPDLPACAPEGREGRSQEASSQLKVGARRAPRLLVQHIFNLVKRYLSNNCLIILCNLSSFVFISF